jgi:hypothetical protein
LDLFGIICCTNTTISSLASRICLNHNLAAEEYFVQKVDAANTSLFLGNLEECVCSYGFKNNDLLVIETKSALPLITFDLYVKNENSSNITQERDSEMPLSPVLFQCPNFLKVKSLSLKSSSSYLELRSRINLEKDFKNFPTDMRISQLSDQWQPITILKKNENSFESLGFCAGATVNLLIEPCPTVQAQKILLRVFLRDPEKKTYQYLSEIVFERKHSITELKKQISSVSGIKNEDISLAVYAAQKYKWKSLETCSSKKQRKRKAKHKKQTTSASLFKTLPDFSIIGVRDNSNQASKNDDWVTAYDLFMMKKSNCLQEASSLPSHVQIERGISIVQDFFDSESDDG